MLTGSFIHTPARWHLGHSYPTRAASAARSHSHPSESWSCDRGDQMPPCHHVQKVSRKTAWHYISCR